MTIGIVWLSLVRPECINRLFSKTFMTSKMINFIVQCMGVIKRCNIIAE